VAFAEVNFSYFAGIKGSKEELEGVDVLEELDVADVIEELEAADVPPEELDFIDSP
jgi:hypothetical protein